MFILDNWKSRWIESAVHESDDKRGRWGLDTPKKYYHKEQSKGLKTLDGSKYYQVLYFFFFYISSLIYRFQQISEKQFQMKTRH
jgi:hypothetical protein